MPGADRLKAGLRTVEERPFAVCWSAGFSRWGVKELPRLPVLPTLPIKLVCSCCFALESFWSRGKIEVLVPHAGPPSPDACPGGMIFDM